MVQPNADGQKKFAALAETVRTARAARPTPTAASAK